MVIGPERKGIKICYCTDTRPTDRIVGFARDADLFICEGMYGNNEDMEKAIRKKHMTFTEAAEIAKKSPGQGTVADSLQSVFKQNRGNI